MELKDKIVNIVMPRKLMARFASYQEAYAYDFRTRSYTHEGQTYKINDLVNALASIYSVAVAIAIMIDITIVHGVLKNVGYTVTNTLIRAALILADTAFIKALSLRLMMLFSSRIRTGEELLKP